jgi:stress response protein YsnF
MTGVNHRREQQRLDDSGQVDATETRSEEELRVFTRRRATQRARLVKHVETETRTVQVRHEQVRVEFEPIVEDDRELDSPTVTPSTDGERWLVLYDEEISVQTRWVPRERVRLGTYSVTEDWEISEDLRRERIEVDDTTHGG